MGALDAANELLYDVFDEWSVHDFFYHTKVGVFLAPHNFRPCSLCCTLLRFGRFFCLYFYLLQVPLY